MGKRPWLWGSTLLIISVAAAAWVMSAEDTGVLKHKPGVCPGRTLFTPLHDTTTYLIDLEGRVVHRWESEYAPGNSVYLLPDGHLLRTASLPRNKWFHGGGIGGRIEKFDPGGRLVWAYDCADEHHCQHHDIEPLPNGNVLLIAWERKTKAEAVAAGRDPDSLGQDELWPDHVLEIEPTGKTGGRVVWEWHVWDHLIQDFDAEKANFGDVAAHPELVDVNYDTRVMALPPEKLRRLRSLGYVGGDAPTQPRGPAGGMADWNHTNSIMYHPELDQILLSVAAFCEIWVIDHSTTTAEAAGHTGGRRGKGGDLLYRWGNPEAYGMGSTEDRKLFAQHDARWIPAGYPGAGHITIFNNGRDRPDGTYSSVLEIEPPLSAAGTYNLNSRGLYGPANVVWEYTSKPREDFFSGHISGAMRLVNGNTLICEGETGRLFEVTRAGKTVWEYRNPYRGRIGPPDGGPPDQKNAHRPPGPRGPRAGNKAGGPRPHGRRGDEARAIFQATRIPLDYPGLQSLKH